MTYPIDCTAKIKRNTQAYSSSPCTSISEVASYHFSAIVSAWDFF